MKIHATIQLDFLAPESLPHIRGSDTSRGAAESMRHAAKRLRGKVLSAIQAAKDGLTDEEIATATGIAPNTARPRRIELERLNYIRRAGTRKTKSGRSAAVWEHVP